MKTRAVICVFACVSALILALSPARADQTDPRLDELFAALQAADSPEDAKPVEDEIWRIWRTAGDIKSSRDMTYGIDAMNARHLPLAAAVFTRLIKRRPGFAEAWNKRATVYYHMERFDDAVADCIKVLDLEPRHFGALAGLGLIYAALGEYEVAVAWFERGLKINPHMPAVRARVRSLRDELKGRAI